MPSTDKLKRGGPYRRSHDRVIALHGPTDLDGYAPDCDEEKCEHAGQECPVIKITVCAECARLSSHGEMSWDGDPIPSDVLYPCQTFVVATSEP